MFVGSYLFWVTNWVNAQDIAQEAVKKRRRATKKPYSRSIVGATLEVIQKRRTEKAEVRDAAREAALRCVFFALVIANLIIMLLIPNCFCLNNSKRFMQLEHPGYCVV